MIRKGNGRQPDNICYLCLIILSKKKACDCYGHLVVIDLSKKEKIIVFVIPLVIAASKKIFVSIAAGMAYTQ